MRHVAVVLGSEDNSSMYCARGLAQHRSEHQATWGLGSVEKLEESAVLCGKGVKLRSDKLICTERGPQDLEALLVCKQAGVADPDVRVVREPGGANSCCIPNTNFWRHCAASSCLPAMSTDIGTRKPSSLCDSPPAAERGPHPSRPFPCRQHRSVGAAMVWISRLRSGQVLCSLAVVAAPPRHRRRRRWPAPRPQRHARQETAAQPATSQSFALTGGRQLAEVCIPAVEVLPEF